MLDNIKLIGLDLDGTLYSDTPEIKKRIKTTIYEKMSSIFNISFYHAKELFEKEYAISMSGSKTIEKIAEQFGKKDYPDIVQQSLEETNIMDLIDENPRLKQMLSILNEKRELDLITSSSDNDLILRKLKKIGIPPNMFCLYLTGKDGSKSSGELYKKWLELSCYPPEQFLYVGDNVKQDIDAPKKLGIKTGFIGKEDYENADFNIKNILELENLISAI